MTRYVPPVRRINYRNSHRYKDGNGAYIPGVTTWQDQGIPKPELAHWRGRTVAECAINEWDDIAQMPLSQRLDYLRRAPDRQSDRAKARGTEVHALAEDLTHGKTVEVPEHLRGHVDSMIRLLDEWDLDPMVTEALVYNLAHEWAGTVDVLGHVRRRTGLGLIDWKTGKHGDYGEYGQQVCTYGHATHFVDPATVGADGFGLPQPMPEVEWGLIGWIRDDGYEMYEVDMGDHVYRAFRYAQQNALWKTDMSKTVVSAALTPPVEETA